MEGEETKVSPESEAEMVAEEAEVEAVAASDEPDAESAPPSLAEQLASAQAEAEDYKDRWLRSQAEFANARKRMEKERLDLYAMATTEVMRKLLPILDDFDRAMENTPADVAQESWLEGIQLVQRKLQSVLENFNVSAIEAVGQPFDPNLHEAITQEPSDEYESGTVCRELQKGYKIGDRVIRPSLVAVVE